MRWNRSTLPLVWGRRGRVFCVEALPCDADSHEPNDLGGEATYLGEVSEDDPLSTTGTICLGDDDYFRINAIEVGAGICIPGSHERFTLYAHLVGNAAGDDIDPYLYNDSWSEWTRSTSDLATENIAWTWDGRCGEDDSRTFGIRVVGHPDGRAIND